MDRSGIGRELALAALARGDKVIATARGRTVSKLEDLKQAGASTLELDVTSPLEKLHDVAKEAIAFYGKVDILVNNAGTLPMLWSYGEYGLNAILKDT